jgi:hypothetical protein
MDKIKKKPRFKTKRRTKKLRNKNNNKPKILLKYKFIIIVVFLLSLYLMYKIVPITKQYNPTKMNYQKSNLSNIKNIFNY